MAQQYAVAPDHDNEGDLEFIHDIRVDNRPLLSGVEGLGDFDDGLERGFIGGTVEDVGSSEWDWTSASMWPHEYGWIRTNILGGLRSGPVTVRTKRNDGTYANYNATLTLPKRGELTVEAGGWYKDVRWRFTSGEELPE